MREIGAWIGFGLGIIGGLYIAFLWWAMMGIRRGMDRGRRAFLKWIAKHAGFRLTLCPSCGRVVDAANIKPHTVSGEPSVSESDS